MKKVLIILGSSRSDGDTAKGVAHLNQEYNAEIIDLSEHQISYYDYEHRNQDDDFHEIAQKMAESDTIVFSTPVYWYSMSAQMKTFFDRLSDLLTIRKELGHKLRGKEMYFMACSANDDELTEGFELPFQKTASYMGMKFGGYCYWKSDTSELSETTKKKIDDFKKLVFGESLPKHKHTYQST